LDIQKRFMELERDKGVTEKDLHQNPKGVLKEYKEEHEKLDNRYRLCGNIKKDFRSLRFGY